MNDNVPVALFVYNRPEHTKRTIEALACNTLAAETDLYIFSDGYKTQKDRETVEVVREYVDQSATAGSFRKVTVIKSPCNKGLAESIIDGVTQMINIAGSVIVLEDDLLTAPYFLQYMNEALSYYESDERIWGVSAYSSRMESVTKDVYFTPRISSWGWATWRSRWEQVDWEVRSYPKFRLNLYKRLAFNRGGKDLSYMLDQQMRGRIDSWAIRFCYSQFELKKFAVFPRISLVRNIGQDGSGTHCRAIMENDSFTTVNTDIDMTPFYIEKRIMKEYQRRKKISRLGLLRNYAMLLKGK